MFVLGVIVNWTDPLRLEKWHTPDGAHIVGRPGTIVPPGGSIGKFIENNIASGYTLAEIHDNWVDVLTNKGIPDIMANVPTMIPAYYCAVYNDNSKLPAEKRPINFPS